MELILTKNQDQLKRAISVVNSYDSRLHLLNQWWGKISLIGKINSQNVSGSILDDMQYTKDQFTELQERLIQNLMREHLQKRIADDHGKSQVAIDILIRNLFERTADVGFLATDEDLRQFLAKADKQQTDCELTKHRLDEYCQKYSVYDEIIVLDTKGVVQAHLDQHNPITQSFDPLINETLTSNEDYIETFRHSDLQPKRRHSLIYSCAIRASSETNAEILGVLCLCFKFDDELQGIFTNLQSQNATSSIMIIDSEGETIASSHPNIFPIGNVFPAKNSPELVVNKQRTFLSTLCETKGYQGFFGLGWRGLVMTSLAEAFSHPEKGQKLNIKELDLEQSQLFSHELKDIQRNAILVNDDLNIVVLNGIIAAARQHAVEFMPVLEEIKKIGQDIAAIFEDSIDNLVSTVVSARLDDLRFCAGLAVDIMDRNLYERANDCRWWALTSAFRTILQKSVISEEEQQRITDILVYINSLYTVYTNLYLYDKSATIVAVSNSEQENFIGQKAEINSGAGPALELTDSQCYAVSAFVPSEQYQDRHTYIYNASVTNLEKVQVLGGIGIVFDSAPQFAAMLHDSLPTDQQGQILAGCFAYYCQKDGRIISASAGAPQKTGESLQLAHELFVLESGQQRSTMLQYQGKRYATGMAASKGYREYKTTGDYQNDVIALIMVPS